MLLAMKLLSCWTLFCFLVFDGLRHCQLFPKDLRTREYMEISHDSKHLTEGVPACMDSAWLANSLLTASSTANFIMSSTSPGLTRVFEQEEIGDLLDLSVAKSAWKQTILDNSKISSITKIDNKT